MATLTKSVSTQDKRANFTYTCVVTENSYSVDNNTSNVTITFSIKGPWAPTFYEWNTSYGIIVDGSVKKSNSSSPYVSTNNVQLLTWTGNISHSSDGSKKINVSVYLSNGSAYYLPVQYTSSSPLSMGSVTLTTIPRASQPSMITYPNTTQNIGNIGATVRIHTNSKSDSFKHTLRYQFGTLNNTIATNVSNNYDWQIPTSFYAQIPNEPSGTGTIYCDTYNGSGTLLGTKQVSFTTTVPSTIAPTMGTVTLDPVNINGHNILVQGKNGLNIVVSGCTPGSGSSIQSYTFSGPGISTTTTSTSVTSSVISTSGTQTYEVKVTDKRGRATKKTVTIVCYAWSAPSISFKAYRVASETSTTENSNGGYIRCEYTITYSYVNGTNSRSAFSISGGSGESNITYNTWSKTQTTGVNGIVTETGSAIIKNCKNTTTYSLYATITDSYNGSSKSTKQTVFSAERIFNVRPNGTGIAFGKMAATDNVLDSKWPIKTDDAPQTMRNLTYKGSNITEQTKTEEDAYTVSWWSDYGNLATIYYNAEDHIDSQPSRYGYLLNITSGPGSGQVHQIWTQQASGSLYHRGGNTSNGFYEWRKVLDSSNVKDYIVEQGTSGVWYYKKWNSGFAECYGYHTIANMSCSDQWGTLYITDVITLPPYPFTFKDTPDITLSWESDYSGILDGVGKRTTTSCGQTHIYRPQPTDGLTGKISIVVYGKWK
jgi:hypothetical protein